MKRQIKSDYSSQRYCVVGTEWRLSDGWGVVDKNNKTHTVTDFFKSIDDKELYYGIVPKDSEGFSHAQAQSVFDNYCEMYLNKYGKEFEIKEVS
jgi:hypothetical protein